MQRVPVARMLGLKMHGLQTISRSLLCLAAISVIAGCGGGGDGPQVIETEVSAADQKVADDTANLYNSDEYAKAMAAEQAN